MKIVFGLAIAALMSVGPVYAADWSTFNDSADFYGAVVKSGNSALMVRCSRKNELAFIYLPDENGPVSSVAPGAALAVTLQPSAQVFDTVAGGLFGLGGQGAVTLGTAMAKAQGDIQVILTLGNENGTVVTADTFSSAGSSAAIMPIIASCR